MIPSPRHPSAPGLLLLLALASLGPACSTPDYETWGSPLSGASRIVVLFHGSGAAPDDLKSLAIDLRHYGGLEETSFVLVEGVLSGRPRSWFKDAAQARELRAPVARLLERLRTKAGLSSDRLFVVGFSEGGAVAVDSALHAVEPLGGVLVFSGGGADEELLRDWREAAARQSPTPFFVSHGSADSVVPLRTSESLAELLRAAGHEVELLPHGAGHRTTVEGTQAGAHFIAVHSK